VAPAASSSSTRKGQPVVASSAASTGSPSNWPRKRRKLSRSAGECGRTEPRESGVEGVEGDLLAVHVEKVRRS
jgi:hypothetical protein